MVSLITFPKAPLLCLKSNNGTRRNENVLDDTNNNKPAVISRLT